MPKDTGETLHQPCSAVRIWCLKQKNNFKPKNWHFLKKKNSEKNIYAIRTQHFWAKYASLDNNATLDFGNMIP